MFSSSTSSSSPVSRDAVPPPTSDIYRGSEEVFAKGTFRSWKTVAEMKSREYELGAWSETDLDVPSSPSMTDSTVTTGPSSEGARQRHVPSAVSTEVSYGLGQEARSYPAPAGEVVWIRGACKSYGSKGTRNKVLVNLNMTIKEGQIYGLLGASGCGKTTLLSCIVGLRNIDEGSIAVFGGTPGDRRIGIPGSRVGYMPQETALFKEFTIKETFHYFGRIYGMEFDDVVQQRTFLSDLLDLPDGSSRVAKLSGGQQRRVSFAVSLMHRPELLILDEPTVGVDPMLRKSIWSYLSQLSTAHLPQVIGRSVSTQFGTPRSGATTIVITTHYIEEARQCAVVGMMNDGGMLAEDSPGKLMAEHDALSLEEVFLKLCIRQRSGNGLGINNLGYTSGDGGRKKSIVSKCSGEQNGGVVYPGMTATLDDYSIQPLSYVKRNAEKTSSMRMSRSRGTNFCWKSESMPTKWCSTVWHNMAPSASRMWALTVKNLLRLKRSIPNLVFALLLPALQISVFCLSVGRRPFDLKFGVVNDEVPFSWDGSCDYYEGCDVQNISCRILASFTNDPLHTLDLLQFETEEEALEASRLGDVWGYMHFKQNFSQAMITSMLGLEGDEESKEEAMISRRIEVNLDMSNYQVGYTIQGALADQIQSVFKTLLSNCSMDATLADPPLVFGEPIYGDARRTDFTAFMAPGVIVMIVFFMAVGLTGQSFIQERQDGLLHRSWIAGVTPFELVFAQMATQFVVLLFQCGIAILFTLVIFKIECAGGVHWVLAISLLQGLAGMSYGFLLSALCSNESVAIQMAVGTFFPLMVLSGVIWPLEGMPVILRKVAALFPCTLATQAMRDVMTRGWGFSLPTVYLGAVSSAIWIVFFMLSSWLLVRFRQW